MTEEERKARKNAACRAWRAKNIEYARLKDREGQRRIRAENPDLSKIKAKQWRENNIEWARERARQYHAKTIEKRREQSRASAKRAFEKNPELIREKARVRTAKWRKENPEKAKEKSRVGSARTRLMYPEKVAEKKRKWQATTNGKLEHSLRGRMRLAILKQGAYKAEKTFILIGESPDFVRKYLESQFLPGMTWENHSPDGWHIDHKKPCSSFDLTDPEQQKACFHYTNLQPLWATDNLSKGKKVDWQPQRQSAQP